MVAEIIQSKAVAAGLLKECYSLQGSETFSLATAVNSVILSKRIKFPILEYCGRELFKHISSDKHIEFLDALVKSKVMGSWVIAGMMLQLRLNEHFEKSLAKAAEYITYGNEWYVCDIIGERVMGHGLLKYPMKMLPELKLLAENQDRWLVRSVGVTAHYATKKGLAIYYADEVFKLLLSLANSTDFHTKKGIGWGAKTIAKFHPSIIEKYKNEVYNNPTVKQWFKTKVEIGLRRNEFEIGKYLG
ncbi:MAG TPA: DNA alkylation repair protein [Bacteroidia bacterium]|nr:DNA alkylation repair protein [Bacteroidia bacterium]